MASSAPKKRWADGPMKLIATPQYETRKTDLFTTGASHMALLHNAIIRGFNSIYLQAPHVQDAEKEDFVGYAMTWYRVFMASHADEGANLFNKVEDVLSDKSIFAEIRTEHESLIPSLTQYRDYLSTLPSPTSLSPTALLRIMDTLRSPLSHHLHHAVTTMSSLAAHPRALETAGSPEEKKTAQVVRAWARNAVTRHAYADIVPFLLLNMDRTYEDGQWAEWPPLSWAVRWGLVTLAGSWNGSYWLFASCDAQGLPRELFTFSDA